MEMENVNKARRGGEGFCRKRGRKVIKRKAKYQHKKDPRKNKGKGRIANMKNILR